MDHFISDIQLKGSIGTISYGHHMWYIVWVIWINEVMFYSSIFLHGRLFGLDAIVRSETSCDSSNDSEYHKSSHCDIM